MAVTGTDHVTGGSRAPAGVLMVAGATVLFAVADTLGKQLVLSHAVALILAVRYAANVVLLAAVLLPGAGTSLWRTAQPGLAILRGLCLAAASITMSLALRVMPVAETVAIMYLSPLLVLLLSRPVLGEPAGRSVWLASGLGFAGVLLIVRPGGGLDPGGVALCLLNACLATAYSLLTRFLARTETTAALSFTTALVGTTVFGLLAVAMAAGSGGMTLGPLPGPTAFALMALLGVLATAGHFLFAAGYARAEASLLAPVSYLHLFWAGLLGLAVFGHVPDGPAIAGMVLIAVAGVLAAVQGRRQR